MTRFEQEISGKLGDFWKKNAQREVDDLMKRIDQIAIEDDGAAKWKKSGNYLPEEVCEKLRYGGATWFSIEATAWKREEQTNEFLRAYRERGTQDDIDTLNEMRAAFETGTTVVDIISGQRYAI